MNLMQRSWLFWARSLGAAIFGAVFVWAGWLKARDPLQFLVDIRSFHLLPDPYACWLALALPWLEIFAGLAVITGWKRQGGLLLLNALLMIFAVALLSAWARGLDVSCGCFGGGGRSNIQQALLRDAVLLALGLWLAAPIFRRPSSSPAS